MICHPEMNQSGTWKRYLNNNFPNCESIRYGFFKLAKEILSRVMMFSRWIRPNLLFPVLFLLGFRPVHADQFTYQDQHGKIQEIEAKLSGEGQKLFALEKADGSLVVIPQLAVQKRVVSEDPEPISFEGMIKKIEQEFNPEFLRTHIHEPYLFVLILDDKLKPPSDRHVNIMMKKCGRFIDNVGKVFENYAEDIGLELTPPRYPLVMLIFETDEAFNEYARSISKGRGLSAGRISGFYSSQTNYLSLRLDECYSFDVPLHEAIHQLVYNRGFYHRVAPIPSWFNEGIATGFEGDGEKINGGPKRIHTKYSLLSQYAKKLNWKDVISSDTPFFGDVLAGEAYTHAWSLHWLLLTKYPEEYKKYLELLSSKQALIKDSAETRIKDFETTFGKKIPELQKEYPEHLIAVAKKQKFKIEKKPGESQVESNLGEVMLTAVTRPDQGGKMIIQGRLRNNSPIRTMSFVVSVVTDVGAYSSWYIPNVGIRKIKKMEKQVINQWLPNAKRGISRKYRVVIESAPSESEKAKNWQKGNLPVPK